MKFAYRKIITTPAEPVYMSGYTRQSKSLGHLKDLEANALLLEFDHQSRWLHIVIDSINVNDSFTKKIRDHFSKKFNIPTINISVSATHSHSAPAYFELVFDRSNGHPEYVDYLFKTIIENLKDLDVSLIEGEIYFSKYNFSGFYGNRNLQGGSCDSSGYVLELRDPAGLCHGIYANIAVHPTFYNGSNLYLSPDLIGEFRERLSLFFNAPSMICNGTCGDVSTRFFRTEFPTIESVGDAFSKQLVEQYQAIPLHLSYGSVKSYEETVTIDHASDPITQILLNQQRLINKPYSEMFSRRLELKKSWGRFQLNLESSIVDLGDLLIVLLPGDVCSQFGLEIKKKFADRNVIVVGYSNQYCNYMVPFSDYGLFFETYTSRLQYGQADHFIKQTINIMD